MRKLILIAGMLLCADAGFAQSTVNVDKNSSAETKSNVVEITAVAIPMDQKENFKIAPENYHKVVGDHARFIDNNKTVEITAEAQKPGTQNTSAEKKEAVTVKNSKEEISSKQKQKEIEIKAAAIKR